MRKDPIIEEIHKIREDHARRFNYDFDAIFADLQRKQAKRKNLAKLNPVTPSVPCVAEKRSAYRARSPKD